MDLGERLQLPRRRALWRSMHPNAFLRLDDTAMFACNHRLVVVKTRDLLPDVPTVQQDLGAVAFCRVHAITCAGVPCGYAITSTQCHVRVRPTYSSWSLRREPAVDGKLLFTDGVVGITGDDQAIVAFMHHAHWIAA